VTSHIIRQRAYEGSPGQMTKDVAHDGANRVTLCGLDVPVGAVPFRCGPNTPDDLPRCQVCYGHHDKRENYRRVALP